jgi:hypothetical protein
MFCPDCGLEDKQSNQFCRACGTDLRTVRTALERPDSVTASAVSARDDIGRAIAAKIRESTSAAELAVVAEEVLPEVEKFLESPEEKRMRRMRNGIIFSSIGAGAALGVGFVSMFVLIKDFELMFLLALAGVVVFFLGLGMTLNGVFLTVPKKGLPDRSSDADRQRKLDAGKAETNDLVLPASSDVFSSVTEHTTQHLKEKEPVRRDGS